MKKRTILIWDDQYGLDTYVEDLKKALEEHYNVIAFNDDVDFKRAFNNLKGRLHFVILDVVAKYPDGTVDTEFGFKLGGYCRQEDPELPIFFLSTDKTAIVGSSVHVAQPCFLYYKGRVGALVLEIQSVISYLGRDGYSIFIGHGGKSKHWELLASYLRGFGLKIEEFNGTPPAGKTIQARLREMLRSSCFAFLVLTPEDPMANGDIRSRENVIHEIGFFQSHLGFERTILLKEETIKLFSNNQGINYIEFPNNDFKSIFLEVNRILTDKGII